MQEEEDKDAIIIYKNGKPVGKVSNKDGHTDAQTVQTALVSLGAHAGAAKDIRKQIKKLEKKLKEELDSGKGKDKSGKTAKERTELLNRELRELRRRLVEENNAAKDASAMTADEGNDDFAKNEQKAVALDMWKSKWIDPHNATVIPDSTQPHMKGHSRRVSIKQRAASAFGKVLYQTSMFHRTADRKRRNNVVSVENSNPALLSRRFREKNKKGFFQTMILDNYGDKYRLRIGHNECHRPETVKEHHYRIAREQMEREIAGEEKKARKAKQKALVEDLRKGNLKLPGTGGGKENKEFVLQDNQVVEKKGTTPSSLPPINMKKQIKGKR
jgi:hypothetical protein